MYLNKLRFFQKCIQRGLRRGAQSRIPLFPPTFWNSYPAYQKIPSHILHTPCHFQTFKSPIPKNSMTKSFIPKKMKDKSCFRIFYLDPKMFCNLLSSIIYGLQRGQRDSSITLLEMMSG